MVFGTGGVLRAVNSLQQIRKCSNTRRCVAFHGSYMGDEGQHGRFDASKRRHTYRTWAWGLELVGWIGNEGKVLFPQSFSPFFSERARFLACLSIVFSVSWVPDGRKYLCGECVFYYACFLSET
jgi:hypothetical protein